LEANEKVQAMILTSGLNSIFSAGLDLTELYSPDADRLPRFWESFQQVFLDLYGSRLATIAAMNGHALAAGCMLALSCDYRIMSKGTIGLNESKLGIAAPPWLGKQVSGYCFGDITIRLRIHLTLLCHSILILSV
jgi:3,2-trans-enoyl-CoA isomerase